MIFVTRQICQFVLFAEDTNIFYSYQDINVPISTINNELQKRNTWFAVSKLSLNTNKIYFIIFSNREGSLFCTVKISSIDIDRLHYTNFYEL